LGLNLRDPDTIDIGFGSKFHNKNPSQLHISETLIQLCFVRERSSRKQSSGTTMATARTVQDVSPHEFVKAYSAHLKRSGKVNQSTQQFLSTFQFFHFNCV